MQQNLGLTVAYVTHDQEEALAISDHIVVMKKARLAQQGTPQEIFNRPKDTFVADFLGEANLIKCELREIEGDKAHIVLDQLKLCVSAGAYQSGKHRVAIRPNDIILKTEKGENTPEATIKKAGYLGMEMEYTIETRFGDLFVTSSNVVQPYEVGEPVYISFITNKMVLVELEKE